MTEITKTLNKNPAFVSLFREMVETGMARGISRQQVANFLISSIIIEGCNQGLEVSESYDFVMGQGAYDKLCTEVYTILNANAS